MKRVRHPSEAQGLRSRILQTTPDIQAETLPATGATSSLHFGERALTPSQVSHEESQGTAFAVVKFSKSWLGVAGLAVVIGIAYFLASRLGMALHDQPEGLAVFSPAAGIATGALIALGSNARLPVAAAVVMGTIACSLIECSLMMGTSPWLAIPLSLANAGQPLITAWLIERWFAGVFKLEDVRQVLGFLVAGAVGAAVAASAATIVVSFFEPTAFPFNVWRLWFASCTLGVITVAPLIIGLGSALQEPPLRRELIEGAIALTTFAALSTVLILLPPGPWATALPMALAFPVLLWIAVRCRPAFAAAATFVVALTVIMSTTFNLGHFGDSNVPLADRILAAQTLILAGALLTLVLAALFSERRRSEATLQKSKERLQLALDGAELGAFSADFTTGRLECDARAAQFHGHNTPPTTFKESRRFVHPDDLARIDNALTKAKCSGHVWNAEYRVVPPLDHPHAGETRWIAVESSIVRNPRGAPVGLLGVTRDITERKRAEQALADVSVQRALAGKSGLVGTYTYDIDYDADSEKAQISPGYAAIHGLPEGTSEISRDAWLSRVHPEDVERLQMLREQAFHQRRQEYSVDYRILRAGEVRWIESRTFISYSDGHPQRVIGVNIDVTERKRAEERQRVLVAELDHRVKNVLASVSAVVSHTQQESTSVATFAAALDGRIRSMAMAHELLSAGRWQGISLTELVRRELAPYATRNNTEINGPEVVLNPEAGQAMAMVLHELTTNAAKYGALSTTNGHVSIRWDRRPNGQARSQLVLEWQEIGGSPVVATSKPSYGTSTIRDLIPYEFGGTVDLVLAPDGVRCYLRLPGDWLSNDGEVVSRAITHANDSREEKRP